MLCLALQRSAARAVIWKKGARAAATSSQKLVLCQSRSHATDSTTSASSTARASTKAMPDFGDATVAFNSKGTFELFRTWLVFQTCAIGPIVRHCDKLYNLCVRILGSSITHGIMRHTFFAHFCAGETAKGILPRMDALAHQRVGGILDYAAEAKDLDIDSAVAAKAAAQGTVGAPLSSKRYDYKGEALCDANKEIFLDAVRAVRDATPDGFAAIKVSGLGNPALLERMSTCLVEKTRFFNRLAGGSDAVASAPFYTIDRRFQLDYPEFEKGWKRFFRVEGDEEIRATFDRIDKDKSMTIDFLEWSESVKLSEINHMATTCLDEGPLSRSALDQEELELYMKLCSRVQEVMDLAKELNVRVMVDAEWTDIQPAIDHIVIFLQRIYNRNTPIVFNTYQTYLKGMDLRVVRDLERSSREGWQFGAKVVRGAYLVSEREKALQRGLESPVCETYADTEANFHSSIDAILSHAGPKGEGAELLVASHNRDSIEHTIQRMDELNKGKDQVYFGQLLGMADHLTFTLASNGYKAYKYVPYGPIDEVVPYLIRRTQENSAILGSAGVQQERQMVAQELRRRISPI